MSMIALKIQQLQLQRFEFFFCPFCIRKLSADIWIKKRLLFKGFFKCLIWLYSEYTTAKQNDLAHDLFKNFGFHCS